MKSARVVTLNSRVESPQCWRACCLNAATGAFVWSCKTGSYVGSSPAVVNGVVHVGSEDGKIYAFGPSSALPEFPPYLILPLFMMATLLAAFVFLKRKRNVRTQ